MFEPLEDYRPEILWLDEKFIRHSGVQLGVVRLDKIDPLASGNKLFKLHYFLKEAIRGNYSSVTSFGGAYSNHLLALASCCKLLQLESYGIVRGERPRQPSRTLESCEQLGMKLQFVSRDEYRELTTNPPSTSRNNNYLVPEGGYHPLGAKGASLINIGLMPEEPTHICCALGTATTLAGLIQTSGAATVIAVPVLKNMNDIHKRIEYLNAGISTVEPVLFDDFHFGGYAKSSPLLFQFMNDFYESSGIPTDYVYTAKMMFAVVTKIREGFFANGSKILCLHTGGLQGNQSLRDDTLVF